MNTAREDNVCEAVRYGACRSEGIYLFIPQYVQVYTYANIYLYKSKYNKVGVLPIRIV